MEVEHPDYMYEPVRVDINAKGKHRARKNNLVQPSQVRFFFCGFFSVYNII